MTISLAEDRLELAIESHRLGPGEPVAVMTKMGDEVSRGIVVDVYPDGTVHVREDGSDRGVVSERIYSPDLYSFISMSPNDREEGDVEPGTIDGPHIDDDPQSPTISERDPDIRAQVRMRGMGIRIDERAPSDDDDDGKNGSGIRTKVDVKSLPDHLKKEIIGVSELDESSKNAVLSSIGDAALRSLRDVGVRDTDVYAMIVKIQRAVGDVLR